MLLYSKAMMWCQSTRRKPLEKIGHDYNPSLTTGNDNPDKVQEKVVKPKIISLWPTVGEPFVIVIKHACRIVQNVAIDLAQ